MLNKDSRTQDTDISYAEYDHDKDLINNDDLLNGMKETNKQVNFHEMNENMLTKENIDKENYSNEIIVMKILIWRI